MKQYIIIALSLLSLTACGPDKAELKNKNLLSTDLVQNPNTADGVDTAKMGTLATMDFEDTTYNFGNMREGEVAEHEFKFTNNGKTPLIISNAQGSCGCTVPEYPREPIQPGQSAVMKVKFNSLEKIGHQEKSVSISTNSKRGIHFLHVKADVAEQ